MLVDIAFGWHRRFSGIQVIPCDYGSFLALISAGNQYDNMGVLEL